ncbi:MAG: AMP-binding protein, partial [Candidatus Aminicenantes bacterium]|nr:AMP-binding protein [Candidatus Aminicenantes bacterium]NIQ69767.1 AMP-binding protein [Candidatus Aminicenantes bacterium]NIT25787.1 AMP-binding protein [Candidatus Aminicenantes bacterium]
QIYIYFTSGTTGIPRAIIGKNKSLMHFINWEIQRFQVTGKYKFSQLTNPGFDVFMRDIFVPLCAGGTICIPGDEIYSLPHQMVQWIDTRGIQLIHIVPSLFKVLTLGNPGEYHFQGLKYMLLAGEKINPHDLEKWYRIFAHRVQLVNIYGPTETTLAKLYYFIKPGDVQRNRIPIGKPISGTRAIILDQHMNICHPGMVGEIYIRTPYITFGYCNDPELTRQQFLPNPLKENEH